ncbi:MAG: hypothetical protein V4556_02515 [Bacteroidota bacterium]
MLRLLIFSCFGIISHLPGYTQNVGIDVINPAYKLQVNDQGSDNTYMSITNKTTGTTNTDGLLMGMIGESAIIGNLENGNLRLGTNNLTRMFIAADGNVGIDLATPAYKLQVHNASSSNNLISITNNTTGTANSDGLIMGMLGKSAILANEENGNLRLGTNNLTRLVIDSAGNVGIGPFVAGFPDYKLDVSGDINTTGLIRLNGNAGTAGQVLGSNGTAADPTWVTTSYSNNTRFCVDLSRSDGATIGAGYGFTGGTLNIAATKYNLNPTNVTVGATAVTINKSGLYHFEVFYNADFYYTGASVDPSIRSFVNVSYPGGFNHDIAYNTVMTKGIASTTSYSYNGKCSFDIYIVAPKNVFVNSLIYKNGPTNSTLQEGQLYGHLISD